MSCLEELDSIYGGVEGTVVETHGLDGMYPLKEESMLEVALGPRNYAGCRHFGKQPIGV